MDLAMIVAATLIAGVGSVWVAGAILRLGGKGHAGDAHGPQHLLSLAAGALLATAFMHLLPEAFGGGLDPAVLFGVLLVGLVLFFLLDKAELWHHGHEHGDAPSTAASGAAAGPNSHAPDAHGSHAGHAHADGSHTHAHDHSHTHAHSHAHGHGHGHGHGKHGGWALLTGDSVHCFGDGVLIASAFVADWRLGVLAALAVLAHEVPHHVGDLVVLRRSSPDARVALIKVSLAGTVTALGGVVGWWLVDKLPSWLPFLLVLASSSFIYVALADLIPQLQRRLSARQTLSQVVWLVAGILMVTLVSRLAHQAVGHSHEHGHDHGHAHEQERAHDPQGHVDSDHAHPPLGAQVSVGEPVPAAAAAAAAPAQPIERPSAVESLSSPSVAPTAPATSAAPAAAHEHGHGGAGHRH